MHSDINGRKHMACMLLESLPSFIKALTTYFCLKCDFRVTIALRAIWEVRICMTIPVLRNCTLYSNGYSTGESLRLFSSLHEKRSKRYTYVLKRNRLNLN